MARVVIIDTRVSSLRRTTCSKGEVEISKIRVVRDATEEAVALSFAKPAAKFALTNVGRLGKLIHLGESKSLYRPL